MTEQQKQEVTNQFVQLLADADLPIEMLTPEEMQQFLAEHGADPDMQFMINPYSKENPYHNRNYASEEEIKEIQ